MLWVTQHRPHQNAHLISFKTPRGETRQNSVWIWISTSAFYLGKISALERTLGSGAWPGWTTSPTLPQSQTPACLLSYLKAQSAFVVCSH